MAIIYKITNTENNKVYIGQTITSLKQRMSKHYSQAKVGVGITGIDAAIRKYGKESFVVEVLKECDAKDLDYWERFYIEEYNSYEDGYNLTLGGQDGLGTKIFFDRDQVISLYEQTKTIKETASILKCSERTLSNYMDEEGIEKKYIYIDHGGQFKKGQGGKRVKIDELDKEFVSIVACGNWLRENGYSKAKDENTARNGVRRVLYGERKSYCGFHFSFL